MEAVILAGGFGTRLQAVVPGLPKPMAPVAGRPFLEILLGSLSRKGVGRAVMSLGYKADMIVSHFGARFEGIDLVYEIEDHPLGTGGALKASLARCEAPAVLVVNGDTFLDLDARAAMAQWDENHRPIIVGIASEDTARFGRLLVEGSRIIGFAEKGGTGPGTINTGHYVLPTALFEGHDLPRTFSFETDFLTHALATTPVDIFLTDGQFIDIGVPSDYLLAQTVLASVI